MASSQTGHAWTARRLPKDQIQVLHALRGARDNTEMESFNRRFTSWAWELDANTGHAPVPPNCNLVALAGTGSEAETRLWVVGSRVTPLRRRAHTVVLPKRRGCVSRDALPCPTVLILRFAIREAVRWPGRCA